MQIAKPVHDQPSQIRPASAIAWTLQYGTVSSQRMRSSEGRLVGRTPDEGRSGDLVTDLPRKYA
jgi:hypothetical protein